MKNDITIVTAFFDIGRGDWTPEQGFPHYLHRTNDTYFERFAHLAELENEMFIFTSSEFVDAIAELRRDKPTTIFDFDLVKEANDLREQIELVYAIPEYQRMINPRERVNPEYWCADYVIVNLLKSTFACMASVQAKNDMLAWVDFGYCRSADTRAGVQHWQYGFDPERIHLFSIRDYNNETIHQIISNNLVFMTGPCIVASKQKWRILEMMVMEGTQELLRNQLIDDDQTLLTLSYLSSPNDFQIHRVDPSDWFIIFKQFHENIS